MEDSSTLATTLLNECSFASDIVTVVIQSMNNAGRVNTVVGHLLPLAEEFLFLNTCGI